MASAVPENRSLITIEEHAFGALEAMEMDDNALIMSLLQDSPVEDIDEERLCSAIQSLEAEIGSNVMLNDHDRGISSAVPSLEDQHCSIALDDHMDFSWINDVEMVSSLVEDGMNIWSMDMSCDYYEFENRVEAADYYYQNNHQQMFDLEEPADQHTSLWQEAYEPVLYS